MDTPGIASRIKSLEAKIEALEAQLELTTATSEERVPLMHLIATYNTRLTNLESTLHSAGTVYTHITSI